MIGSNHGTFISRTRCAGLVIPVIFLFGWELGARLQWITSLFLPAPSRILQSEYDLFIQHGIMRHVWSSVSLVMSGFALGALTGFASGVICGVARTAERLFSPLLTSLRQVPPIAWLPVIAFAIGYEDSGKLFFIALTVFFPVFVNTLHGIAHVSQDYVEAARSYGFNRWQIFSRVILPSALPTMFTGIRYGAGMSWGMILAAEMISGRKGLGYLLSRRQELLVVDESLAILMVIGCMGFLIDFSISSIERRMTRWNRQVQKG